VSAHDIAVVDEFLRRGAAASKRTRARMRDEIPLAELQVAALEHPDPWVRRLCLGILDHEASDASVAVFLAALRDPVAPVREVALHGLACERCREAALCVPDVVPELLAALRRETSADVRIKLVGMLAQLASRSEAALEAIRRAGEHDPDPVVRAAVEGFLTTGYARNPEDVRRRARSRKAKAAQRRAQAPNSPRT
jgi:hypothetical protein